MCKNVTLHLVVVCMVSVGALVVVKCVGGGGVAISLLCY